MKKCFKCKKEKPLDDFYKHKEMSDGYLNRCKSCKRNDSTERFNKLKKDPEWIKKERKRGREKYHRLNYKDKHKCNNRDKYEVTKRYREKYPEKYKAKIKSQRIKPKIKGNHMHHWSYNEDSYKDVIELSVTEHNKVHRYIIYDQERKMYRRFDNNVLLDTKEKHIEFINHIIKHLN